MLPPCASVDVQPGEVDALSLHCSLSWPPTEGLYELGQEGATSPYVLSAAFYLQHVWAGLWVLAV